MNDDRKQEIIGYLLKGRKIEAIKTLREEEGLGLKEAKEVIDGLQEAMAESPEMKEKMEASKGCGSAMLLLGFLVLVSLTMIGKLV